jgi:polyisoprenoid-binding protein YceI
MENASESTHPAEPAESTFKGEGNDSEVEFGGPDRDRTDDLFHAMESPEGRFVDGKGLTSRLSR